MFRRNDSAELAIVISADLHNAPNQPPLFAHVIIAEGSVSTLAANMEASLEEIVAEKVGALGIEEFWLCWRLRGRWIRLHTGQ
jgi:hypothetical protein